MGFLRSLGDFTLLGIVGALVEDVQGTRGTRPPLSCSVEKAPSTPRSICAVNVPFMSYIPRFCHFLSAFTLAVVGAGVL